MASATCCDRCGKYYKMNTRHLNGGRSIAAIVYVTRNNIAVSDPIDLCDECLDQLELWLKNEEEQNA